LQDLLAKINPRKWTSLHLWVLCLGLLLVSVIMQLLKSNEQASITIIFSSLLLFAAGSSILNATGAFMKKHLLRSIPMFIVHAILSYLLIKRLQPEHGEALMNVYLTILIFYMMITTISVVFKAVHVLMSRN
jgi:uncharacterized membrane protein